jgi:iron complex outermembrane receptor protein
MNSLKKTQLLAVAVSIIVASMGQVALAQDASELNIEELVTVGSRSNEPRSVTDSPVPVDVFSEAELSVFGN